MPSPIGFAIIAARGGAAIARRLVQQGDSVSAADAGSLVDKVVRPGELAQESLQAARRLGAAGRAFSINKQYINRRLRAELEEARRFIDAT
jgi:enoyl-CoA hydratase/carnithine racemase